LEVGSFRDQLNVVALGLERLEGLGHMHGIATGLAVKRSASEKEDLHALNVLRPCRTFGEESSKNPSYGHS